jgi:hypothetical protein
VQPILLERGCSFEACHSPTATNDFKLRSGTQGFFSAISLERNYELLKDDFLALEFPDARRGRAVAKTILSGDMRVATVGGIAHRGGPVLETPTAMMPADPAICPTTFDPTTSTAFCTIQAWFTLERAALLTAGTVSPMDDGSPADLVYVERDPAQASAGRLEFDTFQPGADLKVAHTSYVGSAQSLAPADASAATSLLTGCAGVNLATVDVQAPDVANDGTTVVFAMRDSASKPLEIWTVHTDGTNCTQITPEVASPNSILIHNFDPSWSPDGQSIVFASTRGKTGTPMLSRKRFLPQSDIWRMAADGGSPEQVTVLSNSEVKPHMMREGRITMTTEKVSEGFYQLSGRRINWDLTDYHPLLGQRAVSPYASLTDLTQTEPSIGYSSVTDIREGNDGNFMIILSDVDATTGKPVVPGAGGALATFNRSIGPFEQGRSATTPGFLDSVHKLGGDGHSAAGDAYRSPFYLPDGTIMAAYVSSAASATSLPWDIVSVNPQTLARTPLFTNGNGKARVDAVLAYKYPARTLYDNRRQLVFGGSVDSTDTAHAVLHMPDAPMVFTVLTGNLRRGRPVDAFRKATQLAVYTEGMAPPGTSTPNDNGIYQMRTKLGTVPLASDGSVRVKLPAQQGLVFELEDGSGNPVVTMGEEHQLGPGEQISMGVSETLFNAVCGGCHGSVSGQELDIAVTPDALTGASASLSATSAPASVGP